MHLNAPPGETFASARPLEFRLFLQEELVRRCKKNPRFSLRAFARTLEVEASALSKILNGKRSLTPRMLHRLSAQLGLGPDEVNHYEQALSASRPVRRRPLPMPGEAFRAVAADEFALIADWYHYAILELVTVRDFQPNAPWIARALGITVSEANFAVERLFRMGLLEEGEGANGKWRQRGGPLSTAAEPFSSAAKRKLQKQILHQSLEALETVSVADRDQSSMTMAVSKARLDAAKEKIRQFRRELCAFLQEGDEPRDEVYQLSVSLFPVSRARSAAAPGGAATP